LVINPTISITISGSANFGGRPVTIKSDATGTGTIGQVTGTLTGATNVTVERYIPNKRSWRALTAPVSTATSINANWQEGGTNNGINGFDIWSPTPGSGITTGGSSYSLLQYNSGSDSWIGIAATDGASSMMNGDKNKPFMAFVTGPYGSGNITNNLAAATTIRATGTILTGTKTYASASGQYSFIGNPYASPLNLTTMLASNTSFGGNIWVWDANVAGDYSVGTYNLFDNGTYSNISSNPNISGAQIQSGQAFFVKQSKKRTKVLLLTMLFLEMLHLLNYCVWEFTNKPTMNGLVETELWQYFYRMPKPTKQLTKYPMVQKTLLSLKTQNCLPASITCR
jgi:hypothetical protein